MTRQKKEILKRISEIYDWIAADTALGYGYETNGAYESLYAKIRDLETELANLMHYQSAKEMFGSDVDARQHRDRQRRCGRSVER